MNREEKLKELMNLVGELTQAMENGTDRYSLMEKEIKQLKEENKMLLEGQEKFQTPEGKELNLKEYLIWLGEKILKIEKTTN